MVAGAAASSSAWTLLEEEAGRITQNDFRWALLLKKLHRIRRLQRVWAYLGQHLQVIVGPTVRTQLKDIFKISSR
jgi:hypothetical protein